MCERENWPLDIDIKYSPTDQLVTRPLDPIEKPWLQPKRHQITAFWKPLDAERFVTHLSQSPHVRVLAKLRPYEFSEIALADIEFYPELKHDLLFTNLNGITVPEGREPENKAPFLRLNGPFHMHYSIPKGPDFREHVRLLHYIRYSLEVTRGGDLQRQPAEFLTFVQDACEWLSQNFVSSRGKNTADNPEEYAEYLRVK